MTVHSDIKTALLGLIAAVAFIAAAIISVTPARSEPLPPVSAIGLSETPGSAKFNEGRARRLAISQWQVTAAVPLGSRYARWLSARGPETQCDGRSRFVGCKVGGIPV